MGLFTCYSFCTFFATKTLLQSNITIGFSKAKQKKRDVLTFSGNCARVHSVAHACMRKDSKSNTMDLAQKQITMAHACVKLYAEQVRV